MEGTYQMNEFPHQTAVKIEPETTIVDLGNLKTEKNNGHSKKSKGPFPGFRKNLCDYFREYLNFSSIQGFRYIGEQQRSIFERLTWLVLFCISLYFCTNLIIEAYIKWDKYPVIVSFAPRPTPIWKIPFPAVTICSETKARQSVYNYTANFHRMKNNDLENRTQEEIKKLEAVSMFCGIFIPFYDNDLAMDYATLDFLSNVAPQSEEMFKFCKYGFSANPCQFTPILTDDGFCYTFNMLDKSEIYRENVFLYPDFKSKKTKSKEWTLGEGYSINASINTYPERGLSAGFRSGLSISLTAYKNDTDYLCGGPEQGFKVVLHNPAVTPRVSINYFRVPSSQEFTLSVKPVMMTTSDGLRKYEPHKRLCYFSDEKNLSFYQSYTQQDCEIECLANHTERSCGCVAAYMPHERKTPICTMSSFICLFNIQKWVLLNDVKVKLDIEKTGGKEIYLCDCLPECTSLVYNAETSQADYNWETYASTVNHVIKEKNSLGVDIIETKIRIFFKEQQFITLERNELYGQTDFLANCGGLLGLFTGFSFLSLVEIIYFLSLRLFCNVKKFGRHYWSGSIDLVNTDKYDHKK